MHLSGVKYKIKFKKRLQAGLVGLAAILIISLILWNEVRSIQQNNVVLQNFELAWVSSDQANRALQQPQMLSELSFTALPKGQYMVSTIPDEDAANTNEKYYAMRIKLNPNRQGGDMVHFLGVYAKDFSILDSNGERLYAYNAGEGLTYYTKWVSEFFVTPKTDTIYLLGCYNSGYPSVGFVKPPQMGAGVDLITLSLEKYKIRQAVSIFLLLLTGILIAMIHGLAKNQAQATILSLSIFVGLFGLWMLLDFTRHSYWILKSFPQLPVTLLILLFILAKNYMTYAFVQMNWYFLEKSFSRRIVELLAKVTFITGTLETIPEILKFFIWNQQLITTKAFFFSLTNGLILVGSLGLVLLAFYEAYQGSKRAIVLSVGLSICLVTFFISQATGLLISHWGVVAMATAISVILTMSFNEAQQKARRHTRELKSKNEEMALLNLELEYAQTELLLRLGSTVDMRSHETSLHVQRVAEYTRLIATKLGLESAEVDTIVKASTLHDVGKVGIPDAILHMPGKLTPEQFEAMKQHAKMGFEMLNGSVVQVLDMAAIIALTHHERYDGTGYPEGLAGEDIPIQGLIVSAADVLDALLSARVYKRAWTLDEVVAYFSEESGKHFKPEIAKIIIDNRNELEAIIANLPYEAVSNS